MRKEKSQGSKKYWYAIDMHKKKVLTMKRLSLVARLEGVITLLAYSYYEGFKVYQMDVKSIFLNGILEEEL